MNKTAIKNFAIWARNKLIADISYRAGLMGITAEGIHAALPQSTGQTAFYDIGTAEPYAITGTAIRQRRHLAELIQRKEKDTDYKTAYKYIIEEVAYTWFNRLIAVRFMEVNDYLPSHIRVLSSESGKMEPDLVTMPFDADLEFTNAEQQIVLELKNANKLDEVFRLLFIKQCNALNDILPALFEKTNDYTELLLNLSVIDQDGVVYHLVHDIPEEDFDVERGGQVEIIGWLYQYYNTEPKNEAFAKKGKITKEEVPAVTQLFTPDWIVRYMVENSLGRLWIEHLRALDESADEAMLAADFNWKYYLPEAKQEPEVEEQLRELWKERLFLTPEQITIMDPCMGSGHILVYAFEVLMQIYESAGYGQRDAARSILKNNLYGLDIDDRAFQMAYFAVMMKARQYNRRILNGEYKPNVYSIQESNEINRSQLKYFGTSMSKQEKNNAMTQMTEILDTFKDSKEYGSILKVSSYDWNLLIQFVSNSEIIGQISMHSIRLEDTANQLMHMIGQGRALSQKYHVIITNPPYMGSSGMNIKLSDFLKEEYPATKADLSTVFMEKTGRITSRNGYIAMINIPVWMFLSTYQQLRDELLKETDIINMLHFGRGVFGSDFGTTAFVIRNENLYGYQGIYYRLFERQGAVDSLATKEKWFFEKKGVYRSRQENNYKIPGHPIAYWCSPKMLDAFLKGKSLKTIAPPKQGSTTGCNDLFLRLWFEVDHNSRRWFPCLKGGAYRKWYGNHSYVIDWEDNGKRIISEGRQTIRNADKLFCAGISWSRVTIGASSFRIMPPGYFFESASGVCFPQQKDQLYILGLLNSKIIQAVSEMLNPTATLQSGDLARIPVLFDDENRYTIEALVKDCIDIARQEWDSHELSWDYLCDSIIKAKEKSIEKAIEVVKKTREKERARLLANEIHLNELFIDLYGVHDTMSAGIDEKEVFIEESKSINLIKEFISYAVGCMFGRYSLDEEGLVYAGGEWDSYKYSSFLPNANNIIPITDEEYLSDDIVSRFCIWLKVVFGENMMEENLDYIATKLGGKGGSSRDIIRNYFINDFFKDHCQTYSVTGSGKRPIYWLFDSGKQNGFKALIYLHRYNADTIGKLRIDYLHHMQRIYESEIGRMQDMIDHSTSTREVAQATKRREKLTKQLKECREYDEKLAHLALSRIELDLDDGVKVNYRKIQTANDGKFYEVLADSKNIMTKK